MSMFVPSFDQHIALFRLRSAAEIDSMASRVIPLDKSSELASGIVTRLFVPLNDKRAPLPYLPVGDPRAIGDRAVVVVAGKDRSGLCRFAERRSCVPPQVRA